MLIKDVLILKEAENDLDDGKLFYDESEIGVGDYFWDSLIADIESLYIFAGIHKKEFDFHCMYAKRFPYAVYYFMKNKIAYVAAVLPVRRNPDWLKNRLLQKNNEE